MHETILVSDSNQFLVRLPYVSYKPEVWLVILAGRWDLVLVHSS